MGLASALSTALTGLSAAETTIDVVGNNLANSNTVGFKQSTATFATQFLQTQSLGSGPTTTSGGTNPRQIGLGTTVAEISPSFTQGTVEISANLTDLAIQGDGFFIVEGGLGQQLYSRNGVFKMNSENQLVSITGNRLLGYGVNDRFQLQTTTLQPIDIPLGSAAAAVPTANVVLEGTLRPTGDVANTAEIIRTDVLGDALWSLPDTAGAGTSLTFKNAPVVTGSTLTNAGGGAMGAGTYYYRILFADGAVGSLSDTEGVISAAIDTSETINGTTETSVTLNTLPIDSDYSYVRVYRSTDGTNYFYLGEQAMPGAAGWNYTDTLAAPSATTLNTDTITNASPGYRYYVTFADAAGGPGSGNESRPAPQLGPQTVTNGRIQLKDLPVDGSGQWSVRRIYRNTNAQPGTFYYVGEINDATTAGLDYTDKASDASISSNATIDLDGPKISASTLLTNVLRRDGATYESVFQAGTLSFTGRKGGRSVATKQLTITATSTVQNLYDFMEEAMGIREVPGPDPNNAIPGDSGSGGTPGGSVTAAGRIQLVGNNGTANALEISLSDMQLTTSSGTSNVNLPFGSIQSAVGESAVTDFIAYDTLGIPLNIRLTAVLQSRDGNSTTYRWFADSADNDPASGVEVAVGTGLITFDGTGHFTSTTEATVSVDRRNIPSTSPLEFELDFSQLSGLATEFSTLAITRQDGSAPGVLASFMVGEDGLIRGVFSNGITRDVGQIRLARFANPAGLEQKGENLYAAGINSGQAVAGNPGELGIGSLIAGAVELSNADIGSNLIDLILASTMYRGNARVITTVQQMLDELLSLRR